MPIEQSNTESIRSFLREKALLVSGFERAYVHSIMVLKVATVIGKMIGLSSQELDVLEQSAILHDADKRIATRGQKLGFFIDRYIAEEKGEEWLARNGVDEKLIEVMASTSAGASEKYLLGEFKGEERLLQRILFFADEIVQGTSIVSWEVRISNFTDKELLEPREQLEGKTLQEVERAFAVEVEAEIREMAKISDDVDLVSEIRRKVEELPCLVSVSEFEHPQAKQEGRVSEDGGRWYENEQRVVAVNIDGASSVNTVEGASASMANPSKISGFDAMKTVDESINTNWEKPLTAKQLLISANDDLRDSLFEKGLDVSELSSLHLPSASVSAVVIDKVNHRIEIANLGEIFIVLEMEDGTIELAVEPDIEIYDQEAINLASSIAIEAGSTFRKSVGDSRVQDLIHRSRDADNLPDGMGSGVINGKEQANDYIRTRSISSQNVKRIILLTDGMIPQFKADWRDILSKIDKFGLKGLYRWTTAEKKDDPDFTKYPRFKDHDDAKAMMIWLL